MKNLMVCVTPQRNCDRLIERGRRFVEDKRADIFVVNVAKYDYNQPENHEEQAALDYLYAISLRCGAKLNIIRANDVLDALVEFVDNNDIKYVILGVSGDTRRESGLIENFEERMKDKAMVIVVPA